MKCKKCLSLPLVVAMILAASNTISRAGQALPEKQNPASSPASTKTVGIQPPGIPNGKPATPAGPLVTEDGLRSRYVGKTIFLRGFYTADNLEFDENGKIKGASPAASFTLSALEIRKVNLSKRKLEIEADRYALHFFGALPYENDAKAYDKVKISKKPVHISIEREIVVIPKVKKNKQAKNKQVKKDTTAKSGVELASHSSPTAPAIPTPAIPTPAPGTTTSPAHSAMLLNHALDDVFAADIDKRMLASLPDYWQAYFKSKREHHEFMPADTSITAVGDGMIPPKVLNSIDPTSNQYAQKYGIAGLTLFRTVIDASGKPQEVAIARPIGFGLDERAVQAIKASHFVPATKNGHPVPVVIDIVVTFRIYSNRTKPGSVPKGAKQTEVAASAWDEEPAKPAKSH